MSDVVISGYYGFRNNGDDALLMSIINDLKSLKNDIDIVVLSKNPRETERIYKVRAVSRENVLSVLRELKNTKMLISGGGTLMQDGTSTKSLLYYLTIIRTALAFGKKVMLYANGIGPLNSDANRARTKKVLNKVDLITLRDEASCEELRKIGVDKPEILITADPAFRIDFGNAENANIGDVPDDKPLMCVSVRPWRKNRADFAKVVAEACDYVNEKYGMYPVFLPMQPQTDSELTEKIRAMMSCDSSVLTTDYDINKLLSVFGKMSMCIGMRLHTLIYSSVACVPLVGLVYDPKVSGFLDYIGRNNYCNVEDLSIDKLKRAIDACMTDYEAQKTELLKKREELKEKAKLNAELAVKLLCGGDSI